jgi:hypothetical protein
MNRTVMRAAAGVGLAAMCTAPCAGQDPSPLGPGVWVRVSVPLRVIG